MSKQNWKIVSFRLPEDLQEVFARLAAEQDRPLGWVVRKVLREYAEQALKEKKNAG